MNVQKTRSTKFVRNAGDPVLNLPFSGFGFVSDFVFRASGLAFFGLCCLLSVVACGCADTQEAAAPPPAERSAAAAGGPTVVSAAELPRLGDPIPRLDGGRIDVSPPKGWEVPARSNKFVIRFQKEPGSTYPAILVTAKDYGDFPDVSAENVAKLAARIASENSVPEAKPVEIGRFVGVAYRKRGIEKDSISEVLDRLILETVVAGRKYSIELRTREGSLRETQPYLFAVAQGIHFLEAQTAVPAVPEQVAEAAPAKPAGEPAQTPAQEPETKAGKKPDQVASGEKNAKPSEKGKKDDLDLENLNLDDLLKK